MNRFFLFLKKIYVFVLFVALEAAALNYYASSTSYTRARMLTASNHVVGGIHRGVSGIGDYFGLRRENDQLLRSLADTKNELELLRSLVSESGLSMTHNGETSDHIHGAYTFIPAAVINNTLSRQRNFLMLDKGLRDGVRINMALITPDGKIVGYVLDCSDKFSTAISVLNTDFRTGGKLRGKDYFGSVYWNGTDSRHVTLSEIPHYANIEKGDTVVTNYSSIFPPDVLIGTVEDFSLTQSNYYEVNVRLATPMANLVNVFVVDYADLQERQLLQQIMNEDN